MSEIQPTAGHDAATATAPANPKKNPSYPSRIHWGERAHWAEILKTWQEKVATAGAKLSTLSTGPNSDFYHLLYAQLQGGLDQVSDCVRRLPGEAGELYKEDKHRIEQAIDALERTFKKWERGQ